MLHFPIHTCVGYKYDMNMYAEREPGNEAIDPAAHKALHTLYGHIYIGIAILKTPDALVQHIW